MFTYIIIYILVYNMILMIDSRTDIVQYYSQWLENRFNEGFLYVRNPAAPQKVQKIILDHDHIDAILFTSKNYEPALDLICKLDKEYPCLYHYTVTCYGSDIEPGVPSINNRIYSLKKLSNLVGKEKVFWRYDPVFLNKEYTLSRHYTWFSWIAGQIYQDVNRCIYSYINIYNKVKKHMPDLKPWTDKKKIEVAKYLGSAASLYNLHIQVCNCNLDLTPYGIGKAGCVTKEILNSILNLNVKDLKPNGTLGCGFCYPVVNIGEYNTCMNKCKYCYASSDFDQCESNFKKHDPNSPYLIGYGLPVDEITEREAQSVKTDELKLF